MSVYLLICVSVCLFLFVFSARVYYVYGSCCLIQINSVTAMLMQLRLPSFDTVLHNAKVSFCARLKCVKNGLFDALGLH